MRPKITYEEKKKRNVIARVAKDNIKSPIFAITEALTRTIFTPSNIGTHHLAKRIFKASATIHTNKVIISISFTNCNIVKFLDIEIVVANDVSMSSVVMSSIIADNIVFLSSTRQQLRETEDRAKRIREIRTFISSVEFSTKFII